MRIGGGKMKGRPIKAPPRSDQSIRPTTDRVRESLFNILTHRFGAPFEGSRVLDLFAGTGALGLEALSRGAEFALFVDNGTSARGLIRENIHAMGWQGNAKLFRRDAASMGPIGTMKPFDLVFMDPPYGRGLGEKALETLADGGWLKPEAVIVLEESASAGFLLPTSYILEDERRTGDTITRILRPATTAEVIK
ncbi:MAG: 16S rRNA (guanine(966)-N(2))-methyltransferase RsmD [Pseudomonadota bacterium]